MDESRDMQQETDVKCQEPPGLLQRFHGEWLEIVAAILLAVATVFSAWCAYQASRWRSLEAELFNDANAARIFSSEAADLADQDLGIDANMFTDYVGAHRDGDLETMRFYETALFRDEMKVAVEAWNRTDPFNDTDAPETPFDMAEYVNEHKQESKELERQGQQYAEEAKQAMEHADNYILLTVLFASVLFFAGICTKFKAPGLRVMILTSGIVLFSGSVIILVFQPLH